MNAPSPEDVERIARAAGDVPVAWRPVDRGDQTAAGRWVVTLPGARTAFVKLGWTLDTASWIRDEHLSYTRSRGLRFVPGLLGWNDDGERPVLVLEDLSGAKWPPPWDDPSIEAVLTTLQEVASAAPPDDLPRALESQFGLDGWPEIEEDPRAFLALGLCSEAWLARALPALRAASAAASLDGEALLHFDVRSDNLCILDGRAILVDWNFACIGNPLVDVAAWLPSLEAEGGPKPEDVVGSPDGIAEIASLLAGYFCARAGHPSIPEAPHVRPLQLMQSRTALPWAARTLDLPPPG